MDKFEIPNRTAWECKCHVVFIPRCRGGVLYRELRQYLREVFRWLTALMESHVEEGHLMPDRVNMMPSIPLKYAVSQVLGFIKGRCAIHLARVCGEHERNSVGQHCQKVFRFNGEWR